MDMARNLNKAQVIGYLGADPTINRKDNMVIANISIATGSSYQDKTTGEKIKKTEWHKVVFFGKIAEIVEKYLSKGDKIFVEGPLRTRKWEDKEKVERYTTEIIANTMEMLVVKGKEEKNPYIEQDCSSDIDTQYDNLPF
jgi:single-strand DNA-binding protein